MLHTARNRRKHSNFQHVDNTSNHSFARALPCKYNRQTSGAALMARLLGNGSCILVFATVVATGDDNASSIQQDARITLSRSREQHAPLNWCCCVRHFPISRKTKHHEKYSVKPEECLKTQTATVTTVNCRASIAQYHIKQITFASPIIHPCRPCVHKLTAT